MELLLEKGRCGLKSIRLGLIPILLAGALTGCAGQTYDHDYFFFSDGPGNGHSRGYTYPTDYTRGYRSYPGDSYVETH